MSNKPRPVDIELVMRRTYSDGATVTGQDGKSHAVAQTGNEQAILLLDGITHCAAHPRLNPGVGRLGYAH